MIPYQKGISLPEILIALLLSSVIMTALVNQFIGMKQHFKQVNQLIEQDIELQLVTHLISDNIRRAGFTPCSSLNQLITADRLNDNIILKAIDENAVDQAVLKTQRMSEDFERVESFLNSYQLETPHQDLKSGQKILISDCFHAEVQQITAVRRSQKKLIISLAYPLLFHYQPPVYIGQWLQEQFYINHKKNKPSLFYKSSHAEELSPLITFMSLGVNRNSSHDMVNVTLELQNEKQKKISVFVRS